MDSSFKDPEFKGFSVYIPYCPYCEAPLRQVERRFEGLQSQEDLDAKLRGSDNVWYERCAACGELVWVRQVPTVSFVTDKTHDICVEKENKPELELLLGDDNIDEPIDLFTGRPKEKGDA